MLKSSYPEVEFNISNYISFFDFDQKGLSPIHHHFHQVSDVEEEGEGDQRNLLEERKERKEEK